MRTKHRAITWKPSPTQKWGLGLDDSPDNSDKEEEIRRIRRKYEALRQAFKRPEAPGYWQKRLEQVEDHDKSPFEVGAIFAQLGEIGRALQSLAKAYEKRDTLNYLLFDHRFDSLHRERPFQDLLKKIGYPDNQF